MPFLIEQKFEERTRVVPISQEPELKEILREELVSLNSTESDENFQAWWKQFSINNQYIRQTVFPDEIVSSSRQYGFRPPTSDEWEYDCSAGSRTLWRWGNECPLYTFPSDIVHEEQRTRSWDLNIRPNAFGLTIAFDDYSPELCEDGIKRGGDGGGSTCGGAGFLAAWLTLASAYFANYAPDKYYEDHLSANPHDGSRRVFLLD